MASRMFHRIMQNQMLYLIRRTKLPKKKKMLLLFCFVIIVDVLLSYSTINTTTTSIIIGTKKLTREEEEEAAQRPTTPTFRDADLVEEKDDPPTTTTIHTPLSLNNNRRRDDNNESNNNNNNNNNNSNNDNNNGTIIPNKKKQKEKKIRLPDIQLIGAQKAGTSTLAVTLFKKHGVCNSKGSNKKVSEKEVHFFTKPKKFQKGLGYYSRLFEHCFEKKMLSMDATPNYLRPGIARKVHEAYDSVGQAETLKIIATLREPVSRELSMYNHHLRHYLEKKKSYARHTIERKGTGSGGGSGGGIRNFTEFVNEVSLPSIEKGTCYGSYDKHLEEWFGYFDRKTQILVLSFDELVNDEKTYFQRVLNFLYPEKEKQLLRRNTVLKKNTHDNKIKKADCSDHTKLATAFAKHNEDFYTLLESNPGPEMEQRPFPRFQPGQCEEEEQGTNATENKQMN